MQTDRINLISQAEYARYADLARSTVSRQVRSGVIPSHNGFIDPQEADLARARNLDPVRRAQAVCRKSNRAHRAQLNLISQAEYARYANLAKSTVSRQIRSGAIPSYGGLVDPQEADLARERNLDPARRARQADRKEDRRFALIERFENLSKLPPNPIRLLPASDAWAIFSYRTEG